MHPRLARASEAVRAASERTDDATAREQLDGIDEALSALADDGPADPTATGDRLEEIERQLVELGEEADGAVHGRVETARDQLDAYRREEAPDWE